MRARFTDNESGKREDLHFMRSDVEGPQVGIEHGVRGAETASLRVDLVGFGRRSTVVAALRRCGGDGGRVCGRELHSDAEVAQRGSVQGRGPHRVLRLVFYGPDKEFISQQTLSGVLPKSHALRKTRSDLRDERRQVRRRAEKGPRQSGDEGPAVQVRRGKL